MNKKSTDDRDDRRWPTVSSGRYFYDESRMMRTSIWMWMWLALGVIFFFC